MTAAEWNVMECLWEESPQTLMQLVSALRERVGWVKSATATMLSKMEKKGLVVCGETEKPRRYTPAVKREDAVEQETRSLMDRVRGAAAKSSRISKFRFTSSKPSGSARPSIYYNYEPSEHKRSAGYFYQGDE